MKKTILTLVLLAATAAGVSAQIAIGGGYLNSTTTTKTTSNSNDVSYDGFYAGAGFAVPITGGLGFAPGLYYSYLKTDSAISISESIYGGVNKVNQYISVPVNLFFGAETVPGLKISIYGGPTFNYCLSSITTYKANAFGASVEKDIDNFKQDPANKRFDILLGGGVAIDVAKMLRISCGYNFGLLDLYSNEDASDGITVTRRGLNAGLAFVF